MHCDFAGLRLCKVKAQRCAADERHFCIAPNAAGKVGQPIECPKACQIWHSCASSLFITDHHGHPKKKNLSNSEDHLEEIDLVVFFSLRSDFAMAAVVRFNARFLCNASWAFATLKVYSAELRQVSLRD